MCLRGGREPDAEFSNNALCLVLMRPNQLGVFGRPKSGLKDASVNHTLAIIRKTVLGSIGAEKKFSGYSAGGIKSAAVVVPSAFARRSTVFSR